MTDDGWSAVVVSANSKDRYVNFFILYAVVAKLNVILDLNHSHISLTWYGWAGRRSQFPNLSRFAQNILSIPGKFATDFFSLFGCLVMFLSLLHSNQDLLLL